MGLLQEMRRSRLEPDVISYNAAISACEKGERVTRCGFTLGKDFKHFRILTYKWPHIGGLRFARKCRRPACARTLGDLAPGATTSPASSSSSDDSSGSSSSGSSGALAIPTL